jgi:hypothetical protein
MFTQNYSETEKKEIELKGFNADDFELLLTHIYGGSVSLNDDNAYRLLRISHYLNLRSLEDSCTDYLVNSNSIPLNAAICIFLFASRTGGTPLVDEFTKRMAENFVAVSKNEKFLRVSGAELLKILSHPNLNSDSSTTLDFLTSWMKSQSDENRNFLPDLLNTVHLDNVPKEWLAKMIRENTVRPNPLNEKKRKKKDRKTDTCNIVTPLREDTSEMDQLFFDVEMYDAEMSHCTREVKLPFILYTQDVRNGSEYFINRYKFETTHNLRFLNTGRDPKIEYDKVEFCKCAVVDKVHMMMMINRHPINHGDSESSGYTSSSDSNSDSSRSSNPSHTSSSKFSFNPYFHYESDIYAMKSHHETGKGDYSCATMTTLGVNIYVFSAGKLRTFNCQNNEWIDGRERDVPVKTMYSSLLSHNDSLYVVGGKRPTPRFGRYLNEAYKNGRFFQHYDIREGKWTRLPRMKYAHNRSACCIHDDILYVSGGAYLTYFKGCIECFDFKAGKWRAFQTTMPQPKMDHTLIAYDDQLWFFGGRQYKSGKTGVVADLSWYSYDLKEHKWSDTFFIPTTHNGVFTTQKIFDVVI